METDASKHQKSSRPSSWLIGLLLLLLFALATYWYFISRGTGPDTRYAFAIGHSFDDPVVFYEGQGLQFDLMPFDRRLLKVYIPAGEDLSKPRHLLVEDGELDFLGLVKKDQTFIPLQLFQIHNDRPGKPESPVSDCVTYLEVPGMVGDTILVLIDRKYILQGTLASPALYAIRFCETTREHEFQVLGPYSGTLASKGGTPSQTFWYRIQQSGDTIRFGQNPALAMYSLSGGPAPVPIKPAMYGASSSPATAVTKVIFSMPRSMESPWVYLNDKRLTKFTLNATRNQVIFWVKQNGQQVNVRVGDSNCECQGSGQALNPVLELAGFCECRDVQVSVQLDPGLDRFRNKIRIYVDGQLTDIRIPPAGQPLVLSVRKTDRDQFVEMKLLLPDDDGNTGLFDLCSFTVPTESTRVNMSPSCHCAEC
ncbi:MAG: hypothetical protein EP344_10945, partial [Bacteroidetes bacterium]